MFQFHKVRLKVTKELYVSETALIVFQFHKVRLKEVHAKYKLISDMLFQFHKVRLKVNYPKYKRRI